MSQLQHTIAAIVMEVAYLATGLILCFVGKILLEKGIKGDFTGEGEVASKKFRIVTSSPGLVFLVCGLGIIIGAIVTQSKYVEGLAEKNGNEESLEKLGRTVTMSVLSEPSPEQQFVLSQYESARQLAKKGKTTQAAVFLARAVVFMPNILPKALKDPTLKDVIANNFFKTIVRGRFRLPLEITEISTPTINTPILGHLRLYIASKALEISADTDVTEQLEQVPKHPQSESVEKTIIRLKSLLSQNPRALLELLEDPDFAWILQNNQIITALRTSIDEQLYQ